MQLHHSTPRLNLSPLTTTDARFIIQLVNTPGWLAFIGDRNVHNDDDALAYIKRITDNPNVIYWVVRQNETNDAIGVVTFIKREYLDHHDIGFAFLPQYAKQGFAYEAAMAVLADVMIETKTVLATTVPENTSSIQLLEKMGLSYEREITDEGDNLLVYGISIDKFYIDRLIHSFFSIFTNRENEPDWSVINNVCIPEAIIIKKTGLSETVYNLESFIEPRKKILTDGTLTDFEEKEIKEETKVTGNIAQRYAVYKKTGMLEGKRFEEYGDKLFQFIKTTAGWRINAVVWEDRVN
jgi:RimJ/RimL family protein N-acetyltransferase